MNNVLRKITLTHAGYGITLLRIVVGLIFAAHGSQKLFGWFDGPGLEGIAQWLESLGMTPGYLFALLSGSAEFFAGLALVLGLLVRPAAVVLAFTMLVAIFSVHIGNGLFMSNNGYEYALTLLVVSLAILLEGAGKLSIDEHLAD